jgi:hypothetical protein
MIHDLKIWPEYFEAVRSGLKTFEIRKNDRGYQVGESLHLIEYDPNTEEFTGRSVTRLITYIVEGPPFMAEGWAVLGMDDEEKSTYWCAAGYRAGFESGCDITTKKIMGTGRQKPIGILNILDRSSEPIHIRAERMIDENQERNKEFRHVR